MIRVTKKALQALQAGKKPEPSEAEFTKQVIAFAQAHGWLCAHFRGVCIRRKNGSTHWQTPVQGDGAGFFDLVLVRDCVLFVELKVGRNKPSAEQELWRDAVLDASGEAHVWYPHDWPEIVKLLT